MVRLGDRLPLGGRAAKYTLQWPHGAPPVMERLFGWGKGRRRKQAQYHGLAVIQNAWNSLAMDAICQRIASDADTIGWLQDFASSKLLSAFAP